MGQAGGGTPDLETVSSVVRQPLAAAGYRLQVAVLPRDPADAERQIAALLKTGSVVLVAPEPAAVAAVNEPIAAPEPAPAKPAEAMSTSQPQVQPVATREEASESPRSEQGTSEPKPAGEPAAGPSTAGQAPAASGTGSSASSPPASGADPNPRWSPLLDRLRQQRR